MNFHNKYYYHTLQISNNLSHFFVDICMLLDEQTEAFELDERFSHLSKKMLISLIVIL